MLLNKTESYCSACRAIHNAAVKIINEKVILEIFCPDETKTVLISNHANIYKKIREKSSVNPERMENNNFCWGILIELTKSCNFECPICYASSKMDKTPEYLNLDYVIEKAGYLYKQNYRNIILTGGEPTLHPELYKITKRLWKMGFFVSMPTNGYFIGRDKEYAKKLKKNKLYSVKLQFDTLNSDNHRKIRGNDFLPVKLNAMKNLKNAEIDFGIICTVIKSNLHEVGKIIKFASHYTPYLNGVALQAASPAGRFNHPEETLITREDIIKSLINSKDLCKITEEDFWPVPKYNALWMNLHPDCAALLFLYVSNGKINRFENVINIKKFYRLMAESKVRPGYIFGYLYLIKYLFQSLHKNKIAVLIKILFSLIMRKGNISIILVVIEQYCDPNYCDEQRIKGCITKYLTPEGLTSVCRQYQSI